MCRKLTRQQWYNQRITCISHFYAEQGVRYTKPEIVQGLVPPMKIEDFMSVVPHWADNNKRAVFMELVRNWVSENPDFKAVRDRNKVNRGHEGTHTAGSSSTDHYRDRDREESQEGTGEMEAWEHMKLVTPGPNESRPVPAKYFGKAKENKEKYCEKYAKLHPEVEDPTSEPIDEIKATLPSDSYGISSRTTCRSRAEVDAHLEEAYAAAYEEYLEKVQEHDLVKDTYFQWSSNQMATLTRFMMTGVREETQPEPPHPGSTPVFPSKEFYCMYKRQRQLTPSSPMVSLMSDDTHPDHACRLVKSLYDWFQRFHAYVRSIGVSGTGSDSSLFVLLHGTDMAYLFLFVDDIVLMASSTLLLRHIIDNLHRAFAMKDLGPLHFFLGIQVQCTPAGFFLSQERYAEDLFDRVVSLELSSIGH
ncbi:hypothetical protein QYE76_009175 [Lolium multiflorum]|uniref:Reverse transcriptase Ty1/copia-type domain-containing protein n=1 Tax=Lolium multiflorum TaxID=4521 RepID=A0AAD8X0P1_LOLMU|nr:hypothetical protein QYE76_009175 [Lolium multiflorum]